MGTNNLYRLFYTHKYCQVSLLLTICLLTIATDASEKLTELPLVSLTLNARQTLHVFSFLLLKVSDNPESLVDFPFFLIQDGSLLSGINMLLKSRRRCAFP